MAAFFHGQLAPHDVWAEIAQAHPSRRSHRATLRHSTGVKPYIASFLASALITALLYLPWTLPAWAAPRPQDTIAQRVQACTTCHGKEGRAAADGYYPRLAGKPAGYLYNQLINFREGRRHYGLMDQLVAPLSDAYLREIAEYFEGLDLPYPPATGGSPNPALMQRGQTLALKGDAARQLPACAQCHGNKLTGLAPAIPGLLGLPRDYLNGQLGAWKSGQRRAHAPDCMGQIAKTLSNEDIAAVATWLSAQSVPVPSKAVDRLEAPLPLRCGGVPQEGGPRP